MIDGARVCVLRWWVCVCVGREVSDRLYAGFVCQQDFSFQQQLPEPTPKPAHPLTTQLILFMECTYMLNGRKRTAWQGRTETPNDQLPCWKQLLAHSLCIATPAQLLRGLYTWSLSYKHTHTRARAQSSMYTQMHVHILFGGWLMSPALDLAKQRADVWHGAHTHCDSRVTSHCSQA